MRVGGSTVKTGLLRPRGGVSVHDAEVPGARVSSPPPRRCFHQFALHRLGAKVFSAPAEVFPCNLANTAAANSLLRPRGGVSPKCDCIHIPSRSPPPPRRCFHVHADGSRTDCVFSAPAEVFPGWPMEICRGSRLLRPRGGVSCAGVGGERGGESSPPPRRCFFEALPRVGAFCVFSAPAEVFPA